MKFKLKNIVLCLAVMMSAINVTALDLPVKRVNGTDYYCYTVGRNESLADIAHKLGVSRDDILRSNPSASDGVRNGNILYLPVYEFAENNTSLPGQSSNALGASEPVRYKVSKGETLYGIAYRFDVRPDDIVALNPQANSGVKAGQILLIPHPGLAEKSRTENPATVPAVIPPSDDENQNAKTSNEAETDAEEETVEASAEPSGVDFPLFPPMERRLRPVNPPIVLITDSDFVEEADTVADPVRISLLMPLMLNEENPGKKAQLSLDFIKGFMLGAASFDGYRYPVNIDVFDTEADLHRIFEITNDSAYSSSDIVIVQEENYFNSVLLDSLAKSDGYILNLFAAHDSSYISDSKMIQANIPAAMMYGKAAQALLTTYDGYIPVFLMAKGGRAEKIPFINYLKELLKEQSIDPIEIVFDGMLTSADIADFDFTARYVFIPASGSLTEFNKFAGALLAMKENIDDPSAIALFGYPDWTTFLGEPRENLHRLGATIYSRFYLDGQNPDIAAFNSKFEDTYGSAPDAMVPSQSALGYDAARFLLRNIDNNEGSFAPYDSVLYDGVQTSYMLTSADEESDNSGAVNTSMYIVTFLPGNEVSVLVI